MFRTLLIACLTLGSLTAQTTLDVRVYDWGKTPVSALEEAGRTVAKIYRQAGIEVRWIVESPEAPEARIVKLVDPPRKEHLRRVECAARRDIALLVLPEAPEGERRGVMGYANPLAPAGINATIYRSRVVDAVREHGVTEGVLLGHAVAHEIGHVLLRSSGHGSNGLMAGGWNDGVFRQIRTAGLPIGRSEGQKMQAALSGEGCAALLAGN